MGLRTLAFAYLLGGFTFLPFVLILALASAWYLLPRVHHDQTSAQESQQRASNTDLEELVAKAAEDNKRQGSVGDVGASGTFAVLRRYDFQAAVAALNARNNVAGTAHNTALANERAPPGDGSIPASSESVYQSMYRSVFMGNKNTSSNSLLDTEEAPPGAASRRKPVPANIMYIVLRHGHLMLYDSPAQVEVKHVISLAHHRVTLQAGKLSDDELDQRKIIEADLFVRRTAIVLTPVELPSGALQQSNRPKHARSFYLFGASTIEKEDFYHALLSSRARPPLPRPLDAEALIKLQSSLHSSALTSETRAVNALLGRVFLGVHQTDALVHFVRSKIEKKLARIQKPSFIPLVEIRSLDLGDAGPVLSNLKLRDLNISGDITLSADVRYNGALSLTLLAVAKLDLGQRFKTRTVDLVLKSTLQRVSGTMLLRVKPPPSNRIWFTFETMPDLDVRVEPVVSERKITYGFVLRSIEERVRTAFAEGLVRPNWDDIPMPLQDTRGSHARGGLWTEPGEEDHPDADPDAEKILPDRDERTKSTPDLASTQSLGVSTGLSSHSDESSLKLRHASTLPMNGRHMAPPPDSSGHSSPLPKPLRSSSIAPPSPSVAMDEKNVEPVRTDDEALRPLPQKRLWRPRVVAPQQVVQKDALGELRDLRDRTEQRDRRPSTVDTDDAGRSRNAMEATPVQNDPDTHEHDSASVQQYSDEYDPSLTAATRSFSMRSSISDRSTTASTMSSGSLRNSQLQQKRGSIMAAAGAATNAARTWGWNTIQKNRDALQQRGARPGQTASTSNEPMGRGQPLPPPGVPLPGPQKGVWGGVGGMRRKPVPAPPLPARRARDARTPRPPLPTQDNAEIGSNNNLYQAPAKDEEDEFGTWQENPGAAEAELAAMADTLGTPYIHDNGSTSGGSSLHDLMESLNEQEDLLDFDAPQQKADAATNVYEHSDLEPKQVPPQLPSRPLKAALVEQSDEMAEHNDNSLTGTTASSVNESEEHEAEAVGLHVPEADARAIAAEKLTVDDALGSFDGVHHVDETGETEAEVNIGHETDDMQAPPPSQPSDEVEDDTAAQGHRLLRTDTKERFLRGEGVTEADFEHRAAEPKDVEANENRYKVENKSGDPSQTSASPMAVDAAANDSAGTEAHSQDHVPSSNDGQKHSHGEVHGNVVENARND